jgi:hypothetical protein
MILESVNVVFREKYLGFSNDLDNVIKHFESLLICI